MSCRRNSGALWAALLAGAAHPGYACAQQFPPPMREGSGKFRWSAYVQVRYTAVEDGEDLFALRRLKLMIGGDLSPRVQWYAQGLFKDGNASPTDGRAYFQEAWLRYAWRKEAQLVVGQFKPPFGRERFTPDFLIATIDRTLVTDSLTPSGPYVDSFYRDRGVQVDGEPHRLFRYAAGIFDGRGANHAPRGIGPLVAGQGLLRPVRERRVGGRDLDIQLGGAYAARWARDLPFRSCCAAMQPLLAHFRGTDRRWQAELAADWGDASFRAEYMRAEVRFAAQAASGIPAGGFYLQASKYLSPRWQAVCKYEMFDPDRRLRNDMDVTQATAGLNYYIRRDRIKIMAGYVHRMERVAAIPNNLFQVQLQYFIH